MREFNRAIRTSAREVGREVLQTGTAAMPSGVRGHLSDGAPQVSIRGQSKDTLTVELRLKGQRSPHDFKSLDRGTLRHPMWGRRTGAWAAQDVPAGEYTEAFSAQSDTVRRAILTEIKDVTREAMSG